MDINKEIALEQLQKINTSPVFKSKPKLVKFFSYLVNEFLEGRGENLKGYNIAIDVFEQDNDFDPDQSALVRIHAGRLRRALSDYYQEHGKSDTVIISIPKGRYCPEITETSPAVPEAPSASAPIAPPMPVQKTVHNSILVLPFQNLTSDPELNYLTLGFTQEISDYLTQFEDFKIISLGQISADKILSETVLQGIQDKSVEFLVDGSLKGIGNQMKLSIRLILTESNTAIWSTHYRLNKNDDLLELQEKIGHEIAYAIGGEYGVINSNKQNNLLHGASSSNEEYDLLLRYYHAHQNYSAEGQLAYIALAEKYLEQKPDSGLVNALLGSIYGEIANHQLKCAKDPAIAFEKHVNLGYQLSPNNPLVKSIYASKCFLYNQRELFFSFVEDGLKSGNYSPHRMGGYAIFSCFFGEWEKGKAMLDKIFENNINLPSSFYFASGAYYYRQKDYQKALKEANAIVTDFYPGFLFRAMIYGQLGETALAKEQFEKAKTFKPDLEKEARALYSTYIKEQDLLEHFFEGLEKAGIMID